MARCYPWREVVHGDMLSMARFCPWSDVIHGAMLSMARCYPWSDVIHGAMLSMERCYPWRDVIITIHDEMVSNISESFVTPSTILLSCTTFIVHNTGNMAFR